MIRGQIKNEDAEATTAPSGTQIACAFDPPGFAGQMTVGSITIYLDTTTAGDSGTMRVRGIVVAKDSAKTLSAQTEIIEVTNADPAGWYTLRLSEPLIANVASDWSMGFHFDGVEILSYYGDPADTDGVYMTDDWADGTDVIVTEDGDNPVPLAFADFVPPVKVPFETDSYYARLAFPSAQAILGRPGPEPPRYRGVVGWHSTYVDPESPGSSFGIVQSGGPLEDLLGDRVKVTYGKRSIVVFVHRVLDLDTGEDISLSRRAFQALAPLPTDSLVARVEALGAED